MAAWVSDKAQNEHRFSGLPPKADTPRTTPAASSWRTSSSRPRASAHSRVSQALLAAPVGFDRLDVMHPTPIPIGAEPAATRCGEMVEQIGHRMIRTMRGDQVVARKGGPPLALAARDKDGLALFIGEPIERCLDGKIGAPLSLASARVRKHTSAHHS